jgi:aryl-alcohol dehydrogenase-like predicted oxidoreductase
LSREVSHLQNSDLTASEIGLWTISARWWRNLTVGEAIALIHEAFDLCITPFDAYGNGLSEELIGKAFSKNETSLL